jgi:hypothetical protein
VIGASFFPSSERTVTISPLTAASVTVATLS